MNTYERSRLASFLYIEAIIASSIGVVLLIMAPSLVAWVITMSSAAALTVAMGVAPSDSPSS